MQSIKPVVTLSPKGLLYDITEKLDALMAQFYASDANQDHLHAGSISNLAIICKESGNDILRFKAELRRVLEQYLGRYFEMVLVEVSDDTATNLSSKVNITLSAVVTQAGERYDVSDQLTLVDGKFEKITRLNNTGSVR